MMHFGAKIEQQRGHQVNSATTAWTKSPALSFLLEAQSMAAFEKCEAHKACAFSNSLLMETTNDGLIQDDILTGEESMSHRHTLA